MAHRRPVHRSEGRYPRTARLEALLRELLAEEIEQLSDTDDRLRMLTVTGVKCDPDLRHATVLMASLTEESEEGLAARRRDLQAAIGAQARLRRTPLLEFAVDPAIVAGARIEEILRHLHDA
jgi:ribosome-binding factor A